jgi:hypothetical protein
VARSDGGGFRTHLKLAAVSASRETKIADEASAAIRAAQEALDEQVRRAALTNDPLRHYLAAMSSGIGALHELFVDGALTLGKQLEAGRQPFSAAEMDQLAIAASQGAWRASADLAWRHYWKHLGLTVAAGVVLLIAAAAGGFVGGYWWHGSQQLIAGVSAGQQECRDQPNGGTLCYIPMWSKLPPR